VINLRGVKEPPANLVYIGRRQREGKRLWPASPLGNPFGKKYGDRQERCRLFAPGFARSPYLRPDGTRATRKPR
jgi:hypothetical protein